MLNTLKTAAGVLISPAPTFKAIRDNDRLHFPRALGMAAIAYVLSALSTIQDSATGILWSGEATGALSLLAAAPAAQFVFLLVAYRLGKAWGGNQHWRKVFSVILYTSVISIAPSIVGAIVAYARPDLALTVASQAIGAAFGVWAVVAIIIAIKTVNGFGTWKAIAVGLVAAAASLAAIVPWIAVVGLAMFDMG